MTRGSGKTVSQRQNNLDVMLSPSTGLRINSAKHLLFATLQKADSSPPAQNGNNGQKVLQFFTLERGTKTNGSKHHDDVARGL
ncbi:MAG TPA: hypothetical protein VJQ55_02040, partial [Candidatus Binatia bacterium]|nr:hypothetical protein [Candidatus Binatia bacterium]